MVKPSRQAGFSVVELFIVLLLVAAIGFGGYKVYQNRHHSTLASNPVPVPQVIQVTADLKQASQSLDSQPIDNSLDPTQLDKDLQSLN